MKLVKRIKSFFRNDNAIQSEKIVISQKSCPHCTSRGMFVFNDTPKAQLNSKVAKLEPNVTLSLSKGENKNKAVLLR